jgi:hypothetical protein
MEWLGGLALLPALMCGVMMGSMALGAVLGLRRTHDHTSARPTPPTPPATETARQSDGLEDVAR